MSEAIQTVQLYQQGRRRPPEDGPHINDGQLANEFSAIVGRIFLLEVDEARSRGLWIAGKQGPEQHRRIQDRIAEAEADLTSLAKTHASRIIQVLGIVHELDRIMDSKPKDYEPE
ncbi:MAG: hypothetical protein OXG94_12285 [Bacteroidetes bacterium]|nr:hypothetical protein [Bacteroidota bacterium]